MDKKLIATLEAVLFAMGEPTEISKISQVLGEDEIVIEEALAVLKARYNKADSGICLLRLEDKYQICSKMEYADSIRRIIEVKKNTPLSQAAFEVLAIIAYNQPVTKAFVEQIRGVDCSAVISNLCQKMLIEERGRLDLPGRPLIYGTTAEFLRCFCISSLDELPPLPKNDEENDEENEETVNNDENNEQIFN